MFENNMMSINNMENLKLLLQKDNSIKKPKLIKKGGQFTKKFLKWNKQQLIAGKTTYYADNSKYYDPVKQSIKSIPRDKRYKTLKIKPSFLNNKTKINSIIAPKAYIDKNYNKQQFSYVFTAGEETFYEPTGVLSSNILLKDLIDTNQIKGNYRIMIYGSSSGLIWDNNYLIVDDKIFWKEHHTDFQVSSEYMKWNDPVTLIDGETITFVFTKEQKLNYQFYNQSFLDGVSHCFFTPILDHFNNTIENAKTEKTKKTYRALINKITGKELKTGEIKKGYLEIYSNGIKQNEIGSVCEDLQIAVEIEQPFNDDPLFEYRSNKKPLKKFKFVNTRTDHVEGTDIFKSFTPEEITRSEMKELKTRFDKENEYHIFTKNSFGISSIKTLTNYYVLQDDFNEAVDEMEKETDLEGCSIDALKYPELQDFINNGTHFNGTIDFTSTEDLRNIGKNDLAPKNIKHIDMTKAYTRYEDSKYYDGFMGHITDFRKTDNYDYHGLYYIEDIDFSKCSEKFVTLNNNLGWFENHNIYTDAELRALADQKATFKVTHGAYGSGFDLELTPDMINKKVLVSEYDTGKELKIPYYCKYFGMICMTGKTKNFFMNGKQSYFETLKNTNSQLYYENGTARIVYNKKYCFNKKHITAQITAYQRLIMLEQMLEMDTSKIVRVCVDGIYYKEHDFLKHKSFSHKTEMTFKNAPHTEYLSNLLHDEGGIVTLPKAEPRKFYKSELFDGEGGLGKTYYNIFIDKGLIDVCYIPHSWKLSTAVTNQLENEQQEKLQSVVHYHIFNGDVVNYECLNKYSVILVDECSMLTEESKQFILDNTKGKVIFMGDIDNQLAPCEGKQMTRKNIENITTLTKNYRFKDDKMLRLNKFLRSFADNEYIDYYKCGIQTITKSQLKKQYKPEDIILNYYKENSYCEMFDTIPKYKITKNTRDHKNGEIVYDENITTQKEFRHGYTIHSVQGETFDKNIYIDMTSKKGKTLFNNRLFYTAISRARYFNQLYLIIADPKPFIRQLTLKELTQSAFENTHIKTEAQAQEYINEILNCECLLENKNPCGCGCSHYRYGKNWEDYGEWLDNNTEDTATESIKNLGKKLGISNMYDKNEIKKFIKNN